MNSWFSFVTLKKGAGFLRQMRNLAIAASILSAGSACHAALVFSDDFNSPDGPLLGTVADIGGTWTITGASTVNPLQIVSNAVPLTTTGQDGYAAFSAPVPATSGTSIVTTVDLNVSAAQATGDYFLHLSDPVGTTSNFYQRLFARSTDDGYTLGLLDTSGTGSATTWGTTVLSFNTPYSVAVTWNFVEGPTNDTFELDVDGSSYLTHAWTSVLAEPTEVGAVNLRQGTASSAPTLTIDNLQVSAVPEPGTLALAGLGLLGVVASRRRR